MAALSGQGGGLQELGQDSVITGPLLDLLQFTYRANRSVDDAVNMGLHYILQHCDSPGTYVRILFVDFSLVFNTRSPPHQTHQTHPAHHARLHLFPLDWGRNNRKQQARLGEITSSIRTVSAGILQGCVLSPLLFSLHTNDCTSGDPSVQLLKFADVISLIRDGEHSQILTAPIWRTNSGNIQQQPMRYLRFYIYGWKGVHQECS
eukprot:superscaffoldBa00005238_g20083